MHLRKIDIFLVSIWLCLLQAEAESKKSYSASTEALKGLLKLEEMLLENLEAYVKELKLKLNLTNRALTNFRAEELKMRADNDYLENPLNSFALLRHQREDWLKWATYMEQLPGAAQIAYAQDMRAELPTALDLQEASYGIEVLVDYYELEPKELAAGRLSANDQPNTALSTMDCFALGKFNLFQKNDAKAETWLNISMSKYHSKPNPVYKVFDFNENNIHKWLGVLLTERKEHDTGAQHLKAALNLKDDHISGQFAISARIQEHCPASFRRPSYLHCRYNNWMSQFLRLAPLKMEELSMDPLVVLYYDAIYESEINWFLNNPLNFTPALLDGSQLSQVRTAQNVNFKTDTGAVTLTIDKRLTDMTGLIMKDADQLSLINYGIGGHYNLHMDAFRQDTEDRGNRIATALFYLSDVELGGATIFPELNLTIKPVRGNAIVWHNLQNDGSPHLNSWHAACPVIVGIKYVLTRWIYSLNQMFIMPCLASLGESV